MRTLSTLPRTPGRRLVRRLAALVASAVVTLAVAPGPALGATGPAARATQSPELEADRWYNVEGEPPTLEGLRGRAVLIEFWATW